MSKIQRYDICFCRTPSGALDWAWMDESGDGCYVRYSDHIAAIEELTTRLAEAEQQLINLHRCNSIMVKDPTTL